MFDSWKKKTTEEGTKRLHRGPRGDLGSALLVVMAAAAILFVTAAAVIGVVVFQQTQQARAQAVARATGLAQQGMEVYLTALRIDPHYRDRVTLLAGVGEDGTWTVSANNETITSVGHDTASGLYHVIRASVAMQDFTGYTILSGSSIDLGVLQTGRISIGGSVRSNGTINLKQDFSPDNLTAEYAAGGKVINPGNAAKTSLVSWVDFSKASATFPNLYTAASTRETWAGAPSGSNLSKPLAFYRDPKTGRNYWGATSAASDQSPVGRGDQPDLAGVGIDFANNTDPATGLFYIRSVWPATVPGAAKTGDGAPTRAQFKALATQDPVWNTGTLYAPELGAAGGRSYEKIQRGLNPNNNNVIYVGGDYDVYIKGEYSRSVTIVSEHNIYIIGSVTRSAATPTATLGLVAKGNIYICGAMPTQSEVSSYTASADATNTYSGKSYTRGDQADPKSIGEILGDSMVIQAAMLSTDGQIIMDPQDVTDATKAPATRSGTLTIRGSLSAAQGVVGPNFVSDYEHNGGFAKVDINYDDALSSYPPPLFPQLGTGSLKVTRWDEFTSSTDPNAGLAFPPAVDYRPGSSALGAGTGAPAGETTHTASGETTPVTDANVKTTDPYIGRALITLVPVAFGDAQITGTWYILDGGAKQWLDSYTIEIPSPAPNTATTHTVEWGSVDSNGVSEATKTATFRSVGVDTLLPTTTIRDSLNPTATLPNGYPQAGDPDYVVYGPFKPVFTAVDTTGGTGAQQIVVVQVNDPNHLTANPEPDVPLPLFVNNNLLSPAVDSVEIAPPSMGFVERRFDYYAIDAAGNRELTKSFTIKQHPLDLTPPMTLTDAQPMYVGAAVIHLTGVDDVEGQGVKDTWYKLDDGPWVQSTSTPTTVTVPAPFVGQDQVLHTLSFYSRDKSPAQNTQATDKVEFTVSPPLPDDSTPPVTTSDAKASYVGPAVITLTSTDAGGVSHVYWKLDGGATQTGTTIDVPAPWTDSVDHRIDYWAVDLSGNREDTKTDTFTVTPERTAPVTAAHNFDLYNGPAVFQLTAEDNVGGSGWAKTYYKIDSGDFQPGTPTPTPGLTWVTVTGEGTHTVSFYSVDNAHNAEVARTTTVCIDSTAPKTTDDATATAYAGQATINLNATDGGSGVKVTQWRNAADGLVHDSSQMLLGAASDGTTGTWDVSYWSTDMAGNVESPKTVHVVVVPAPDTAAPQSYDAITQYYKAPAPATLNLYSWDVQSGVKYMHYKLDDGAEATPIPGKGNPPAAYQVYVYKPGTSVPADDGTHTIEYWAEDRAGHVEDHHIKSFYLDTVVPVTSTNVHNPVYWSTQTFSLSASDSGSGVKATYYTLDGSVAVKGATVYVPAPTDGLARPHVIQYWSVDNAGNVEPAKSVSFTSRPADTIAPTTTSNASSTYDGASTIVLTSHDNLSGSGVAHIFWRIDDGVINDGTLASNGNPTNNSTLVGISGSGTHTLEYWSTDVAGNVETHKKLIYNVDGVAPTTTSDAKSIYNTPAVIHLTAADNSGGSDVAATFFRIDGGAVTSGTPPVTTLQVNTPGTHTLDFWSTDMAGNKETTRSVSFNIDMVAPTTLSNAVPSYAGTASIALNATDNSGGTGIAYTYYKVDGGARQTGTMITVNPPASSVTTHTIYYWSVDNAGNIEDQNSATFTVSALANMTFSGMTPSEFGTATVRNPAVSVVAQADQNITTVTATVDGKPKPASLVPAGGYWVSGGYWVPGYMASDGCYSWWVDPYWVDTSYYVAVDNKNATASFQASGLLNGSHVVSFTFSNATGASRTKSWTFTVTAPADTTAPITNSDVAATYNTTATISLNATDGVGGTDVANTYYKLDGAAQQAGTPPLTTVVVPAAGVHTFEYWSVDGAGNAEAHHSTSFVVDWTPPTTTSNAVASYSGTATVSLTATDGVNSSGVRYTYYKIDTGAVSSGTTVTVLGPTSGAPVPHTMYFWSVDKAGNTESTKTVSFTVSMPPDNTPPTTTSNAVASYSKPSTITLTPTDNAGGWGVANTYYKLDNNATQTGTAAFTGYTGSHTLKYWSVDAAGNTEAVTAANTRTFTVLADTTPPVTTSNAMSFYTGTAVVNLTATDAGWGVANTFWRVDNGAVTTGTVASVDPPIAGFTPHTLYFWSVDNAGNVETTKSATFNVFAVPYPMVFSAIAPADGAMLNSTNPTVTITAQADQVITAVSATLDGMPQSPIVTHPQGTWVPAHWETAVGTVHGTFNGVQQFDGTMSWGPDYFDQSDPSEQWIASATFDLSAYGTGATFSNADLSWAYGWTSSGSGDDGQQKWVARSDTGARLGSWGVWQYPTELTGFSDFLNAHRGGSVTFRWDADAGDYYDDVWDLERGMSDPTLSFQYQRWVDGAYTGSGPDLTNATAAFPTSGLASGPHTVSVTYTVASGAQNTKTWTFSVDTIAPTTTSNAVGSYTGTATIGLTATDNLGGSGVKYTYYKVDSGTQQTGTSIVVPAPSASSASHTIYYWSVDNAGNIEAQNSRTFTVNALPDTTPPTTVPTYQATYAVPGTITLTATDNPGGWGVANTFYKRDGGATTTGTAPVTQVGTGSGGSHTLEFWSVDAAGNPEGHHIISYVVTPDTTPPTTTSNAVASYVGTATIALTATDNSGGWGVASTNYTVDGNATQTGNAISIAPPLNGSASHTITYWSTDKAGNVEPVTSANTRTFTVTGVAPTFTWSNITPADLSATQSVNPTVAITGAATQNITTATATLDGTSTAFTLTYRMTTTSTQVWVVSGYEVAGYDTGGCYSYWVPPYWVDTSHYETAYTTAPDPTQATLSFPTSGLANGSHSASVSFTLASGQIVTKTWSFIVDTIAPTTTSSAVASYTGNASISLTATDNVGGSGVRATYYKVDGGAQATGTVISVPAPVSGATTHTVTYWSVDNASNVETVTALNTKTFRSYAPADTTPPTTVSNVKPYYKAPGSITMTATDNVGGWGVAYTYYRIDGGAQTTGTAPVTVVPTGTFGSHTIEYWSTDLAGNIETHHNSSYIVDGTPPTTTSTVVPTYTVTANISLTATDNLGGSGVAYSRYRIDSGAIATGTVITVAGPAAGSAAHTLQFWSVDNAGNVEATNSAGFTILAQPAAMTFSNITPPDLSSVTVRNPNVAVTAKATVNITGATATLDGVAKTPTVTFSTVTTTTQVWVVSGYYKDLGTGQYVDDGCGGSVWQEDYAWIDTSGYQAQTTTVTDYTNATATFATSNLADGVHTASVTFTVAGGAQATKTWTFTVTGPDNVAPTTTPIYQGAYVGTATVSLVATDNPGGSGVANTFYKLDGGTQVTGTPPTSTVTIAPPVYGAAVSHTIVFWSVDRLGNSETQKSITFTVAPNPDTIAPTTASSAVASYTGNANISLTASDNVGGWGVATTNYKIDDGTTVQGTAITVAAPAYSYVVHHIDFWSVDRAGNTEVAKTATFTVNAIPDTTPPATTSNALTVYSAPSTITLSPTDVGWGIAATYYKLDGGATTTGTVIPTGGQGSHTLQFWSVDRAGLTETTKTVAYVVDMTAPVTTSNATGAYTGTANITLAATDIHVGGSGVRFTYYKIDNGAQYSGTAITVAGPTTGPPLTHHIDFWSVDYAGNTEVAKTATFTVSPPADSIPPTTTSNRVPFYAVPGVITLTALDNSGGWGVANTYYILDGGGQNTGTAVGTGGSGQHHLEFWSVDYANNIETPHKSVDYNVDMTAPSTTSNALASYTGTATVSLTATDNNLGSGVKYTYYKVDGGTQLTGTSVVVAPPVSGSVDHVITFWSVDNMSNTEVAKSVTITVNAVPDATAPNTTSNAVTTYAKPATITLTATDAGWGVTSISYIRDGGATVTGYTNASGGTFTATCLVGTGGGGAHHLEFWSGDKAGNNESPHKFVDYTVTPDTTPPVTTSNAVALYIGPATVSLTATDSGWGVAGTYYKLDSGTWSMGTTITVPAPVAGSLVHTLQFYSIDQAGNQEVSNTTTFTVAGVPANMAFSNITPVDGSLVTTGHATLSVKAVADQNITAASMLLDGVVVTPTSSIAGTTATSSFNANGLTNGVHTVAATFTNASGAQATKTWSFTVAIQTDFTPPTTTSNAALTYISSANITLTATDNVGGTGVRYTYYRVDGGAQQTGTYIAIAGPASGDPVTHAISFWSVDWAGNTEAANTATFTIAPPDLTAPVSSSDAKPFYAGPSTIQLSAIDNVNGSGVAHIYYKLDGGPQTEATLLGTGGVGSHVLEFWAVDAVGNAESPHHTVTYKVDATAPVTTSDAKSAYTGVTTVTLTPTDEVGGSGIKNTYYRIDDGGQTSGVLITIMPPVFASATHSIYWWSVDNAGNIESTKTATFTVAAPPDTTPPTTTSDAKSSYAVPGLITFTATDNFGGWTVDHTYYKLDGGAQTEGLTVRTGGVGTHTLQFWSVDKAGNQETHNSVTYNVVAADTAPPVTSSDTSSTYVGAAHISLTATDNSGVTPVTHYRVDSGTEATGTSVTVAAPRSGSASHTLYFWSVDINGNTEAAKSAPFVVNALPANMTFSAISPADGSNLAVRNPTIAVSAQSAQNAIVDAVIEVDSLARSTNVSLNGTQATASFSAVGLANGGHTVTAYFTDAVGATQSKSWAFTVAAAGDVTPPVTTSDAGTATAVYYPGTTQFHLYAADEVGGTGVAGTSYKLDGGSVSNGTPPTTTITISSAGNHTLEYWSTDSAGNVELPHHTVGISVDIVAPNTTSNAENAYTGTALVTLTPKDNTGGSGIAATYYRVDAGAQQSGTAITIPAPTSGFVMHDIYWWSVDKAGNVETSKTATFAVWAPGDAVAPTTVSNAQASYAVPGIIQLTATDNVGGWGVAHTYYILDGGVQTEGTSVHTGGAGSHMLEFWSVDNAGNIEAHQTFAYVVSVDDTAAPVTTSNALASYNGPAVIQLTASDGAGSGVAHTYYILDGGAQTEGTLAGVSGAGSHTLKFWSVDVAGNTEANNTVTFTIVMPDATAPVTTTDARTSYTGTATVTLTATDNTGGSGVRSTYYRLDGGPVQTGTVIIINPPLNGSVPHSIEFWSVDNLGNSEGSKTVTFSVAAVPDTVAPVTTSNAVASYTGTATIILTPTDGGSGVKATYYRVDSGPQQTGTTVVIAPPSSGAAAHTIYWWSVDNQNNSEVAKSFNVTVNAVAVNPNATLSFHWVHDGYAEAQLHVENAAGVTINSTNIYQDDAGDLSWDVTVPAGQNYHLVCDYYYDDYYGNSGGNYGMWSYELDPLHKPLQGGDTVSWSY